eukprot:gnl/MRDRNA2_/MRDRNA2_130689_c0_seq1.p1 gnl/MRDRNA2_/MRDRNA2_130689_c0~~gnl/MRDRNA2_/MRDRNA2_130689_c0_seq1.p1  ORF type:complete len:299 (-),score=43.23 gnl/MRDRNA2_/MRDRNA2_130689_c0_seq1:82-924(-)
MVATSVEQVFEDAFDSAAGVTPRLEEVPMVPGAMIIRNAFSHDEAEAMERAVRLTHEEYGEQARRLPDEMRRDSQHHRAAHVSTASLAPLAERIRSFLPPTAGPGSSARLETPGREISTFLRCYYYQVGDSSSPHWDKSFCKCEHVKNQLSSFSAYSLLMYLNESMDGGETTFFEPDPSIPMSRNRLTPLCDRGSLAIAAQVSPRKGDILIFPHGLHKGAHPSPLHEGSIIRSGEKLLVRTDVMYCPPESKKQKHEKSRKQKDCVAMGEDKAVEAEPDGT